MRPGDVGTAPSQEVGLFFRALADETRLAILRLLAVGDLRSGEIGARLHLPTNALAYHLKQLRAARLLCDQRSSADARDVYHRLDLDRLAALYASAGDFLHPGISRFVATRAAQSGAQGLEWEAGQALGPAPESLVNKQEGAMVARPLRVLFLCTHNSARSQLAEGILRQLGGDRVEAYSAGSAPTEIHPDVIAVLRELRIDPSGQYAKSLERFSGEAFDYVVTVCDRVRETCPTFPGYPEQAHWSFPDPMELDDPDERHRLLRTVATELQTRIRYLLLLPHPSMGQRMLLRPLHLLGD